MNRIAITGASGFIGGYLVSEALNRGMETYALLRASSNTELLTDNRINFIYLNLADKSEMISKFEDLKNKGITFDYFVHNAGVVNALNKSDFLKVNYHYTKNLIEALIESDCKPKKFLYISSLAAYGPGDADSGLPIKESDPTLPITLYGKSKLASEQYIRSLTDFNYIIIRPTGIYGPRDKEFITFFKTINRSIEPYIGSPNQLLTFIYIKDLMQLIFKSLESDVTNKSYFATDGKSYTGQEFATIVKEILNKKTVRIIFPKFMIKYIAFVLENVSKAFHKTSLLNTEKYKELTAHNWLCDSSPAERDFAFKAEYDLRTGLIETIEWFKQNGQL